ncbi:sensor histidine kinase [Runella sp.]|uniref:sensor histidine kinase n=1 Tax=Runella sp. TaxID=1960881 RepID=UPI003D0FCE94
METFKKQSIYHIIGGIAFLFLPLILSPRPPEEIGPFFSRPTLRDLIAHGLMLLFFYYNYYVLIQRLYFRKKYLNYTLIIILGFVLIIVLPSVLTGYNMLDTKEFPQMTPKNIHSGHFMPPKPSGSPFLQEIRHHIYLFAVVILFSILLQVNNRLLRIDKERIAAELAHLKAQIHPHFLFNTLNSIYALTIRKDDKAPDSIVKLSEFMRYLLKDANESEVALEKEIDYITNYIDLQVSRLRDSVRLNYQLEGKPKGKKIAPLLLFSFIENAFKHGVNPDENSEIKISIHIDGDLVQLSVRNKTVKMRGRESSTNIGLANTKERLQLYYPNRHTLDIERTPDYFNVQLSIQLT